MAIAIATWLQMPQQPRLQIKRSNTGRGGVDGSETNEAAAREVVRRQTSVRRLRGRRKKKGRGPGKTAPVPCRKEGAVHPSERASERERERGRERKRRRECVVVARAQDGFL
ncbi:hypothetical protein PAAG_04155 [Paracoccidioides lutzii Pb01]|uniref:Uncharacterized protein n=1 Tax=Paracoccidioides lutzii (strain ATCC MYA-826 / Pb01) TaxID=502779 RepID=C1H061_PARBA|nr:hypothetical protein PAAG_04155 [Paracoccidioides lutzii Pb01]EEH33102.2 hypothetical protein PAAG_04155 [Paracoccidioides lutzii Pb01]